MKTYKIHLIRHGKTAANLDGRYIGRTDLPLSPLGEEELRQLKAHYRYPEAERVYSSPLARCRKTATILYPRVPVSEVEGLREADFGVFEGKTPYALKDDPDYQAWMKGGTPPEGEASEAFVRRVLEGFVGILDDMKAREIRSAAVITHGGVIMTILAALGLPEHPPTDWQTPSGGGYTLLADVALWMRAGKLEVYRRIPDRGEETREYGVYTVRRDPDDPDDPDGMDDPDDWDGDCGEE